MHGWKLPIFGIGKKDEKTGVSVAFFTRYVSVAVPAKLRKL